MSRGTGIVWGRYPASPVDSNAGFHTLAAISAIIRHFRLGAWMHGFNAPAYLRKSGKGAQACQWHFSLGHALASPSALFPGIDEEEMFGMDMGSNLCLILDGGLGTTVEELDSGATQHPVWSGKLLNDDPELLVKTHLRFLEAGADVIETATYQSCFTAFARAGYTQEEARSSMLSAVTIAERAIAQFEQSSGRRRRPLIALSFGPYGAQIAQEYRGIYPPPYGPSLGSTSSHETAFDTSKEELAAELALADWHFEPLRIFADSPHHWNMVSFVAFETIPLLREGRAIRRAMERLKELTAERGLAWPKWWISFVYPKGTFPEVKPGGEQILPSEIARQMLEPSGEAGKYFSAPDGLGINCTHMRFLHDIVLGYADGLQQVSDLTLPILVLYPDGGLEYDTKTKVWQAPHVHADKAGGNQVENKESWGRMLAEEGRQCVLMTRSGRLVWSGIIIGGCCKTTPEDIGTLKQDYCY
ncbi:Homocysteine S-methyltransferase [Calocera viscosa TUFC12733]|uniref:Homocysteine S-methyltransferase n=1 Tax=Calocera viscosa (strain TUFC12733) TaxID=1330018 RepID=A0A167LGZ7_CALVF|nr:Homocysteine S-methyltransferase [Calocera viscosa TUFC12733]